jgi:hypothetical protein
VQHIGLTVTLFCLSLIASYSYGQHISASIISVNAQQSNMAKTKIRLPQGVKKNGNAIQIDPRSGVMLRQISSSRARVVSPAGFKEDTGPVDVFCNCGTGSGANGCNLIKDKKIGDVISGGVWRCKSTNNECASCKMIMLGGNDTDLSPRVEAELGIQLDASECDRLPLPQLASKSP